MEIGSLGDVIFAVSDEEIKTIRDAQWSGKGGWQQHKRHMKMPLPEFVGPELDSFKFNIRISAYLGTKEVMDEIATLLTYEREGKILPLILGEKIYGRYRWTLTSHTVKMNYFDKEGNLTDADLSITLTEYPRT